jgi:AGCS family alanine or glycine:cation symporter
MIWGVKRGLFSNEAGQGSAAIAHAAAKTDEPVREGTVAMLGPYIDTLLICTLTGLVIITTGVFNKKNLETRNFDHHNYDIYAVPSDYSDEWMNTECFEYAKENDPDFGLAPFNGEIEVIDGHIQKVVIPDPPVYPRELLHDTTFTVAFVRNHGFIDNPRIFSDGSPFRGILTITSAGTDEGNKIEITDGLKGGLTLEGEAYQNGSPLTAWGFKTGLSFLGNWGNYIITLAVFLFALSTMISWSYYGDRSIQYLIGDKAITPYRYVFCVVLFIGAVSKLENIWGFGDVALGLMAIPNLIAILLLSGILRKLTKEYFSKRHIPYKKRKNMA